MHCSVEKNPPRKTCILSRMHPYTNYIYIFPINLDIITDISIFAEKYNAMYSEIYEKSGSELIKGLGKRYSEYRKRMGFTQKEVSVKSGISVFTISSFENGSSTGITLAYFIKLLRAIDNLEEIEKLLPELPESPRALFMKQSKKRQTWKQI